MGKVPPGEVRVITLAQAMGRVSVQADCTVDEALQLMVERAAGLGCGVYEIAFAVAKGILRFDPVAPGENEPPGPIPN